VGDVTIGVRLLNLLNFRSPLLFLLTSVDFSIHEDKKGTKEVTNVTTRKFLLRRADVILRNACFDSRDLSFLLSFGCIILCRIVFSSWCSVITA